MFIYIIIFQGSFDQITANSMWSSLACTHAQKVMNINMGHRIAKYKIKLMLSYLLIPMIVVSTNDDAKATSQLDNGEDQETRRSENGVIICPGDYLCNFKCSPRSSHIVWIVESWSDLIDRLTVTTLFCQSQKIQELNTRLSKWRSMRCSVWCHCD